MAYGFVYLLSNPAMPCFYKIGKSQRPPHQRATELSGSSGIPLPFEVLCYFESDMVDQDELFMHQFLADFRVTNGREFFRFAKCHLPWLYGLFRHYPHKLSFSESDEWDYLASCYPENNPWRADQKQPDMTPHAPQLAYFEIEKSEH